MPRFAITATSSGSAPRTWPGTRGRVTRRVCAGWPGTRRCFSSGGRSQPKTLRDPGRLVSRGGTPQRGGSARAVPCWPSRRAGVKLVQQPPDEGTVGDLGGRDHQAGLDDHDVAVLPEQEDVHVGSAGAPVVGVAAAGAAFGGSGVVEPA